MQETGGQEFCIIKQVIPLLLEVAQQYLIESDEVSDVRDDSADEDFEVSTFFSDLYAESASLQGVLSSIDGQFSATETEYKAIKHALSLTERKFFRDSSEERAYHNFKPATTYANISFVIHELAEPKRKPSEVFRIEWLRSRTKFDYSSPRSRDRLVRAISTCYRLLRQHTDPNTQKENLFEEKLPSVEWKQAKCFYETIELFHSTLSSCWECRCPVPHTNAHFSFEADPHITNVISCMVCFNRRDAELLHKPWWATRLLFEYQASPSTIQYSQTRSTTICEHFESCQDGHLLQISGSRSSLKATRFASTPLLQYQQPLERVELPQWLEQAKVNGNIKLKQKHRLTVALILAYGYLYLSGGPWWPYEQATVISILEQPHSTAEGLAKSLFFASPLSSDSKLRCVDDLAKIMNPTMPNLPQFGKSLLELAVGRRILWEDLTQEMKEFEDEPFADRILGVARACMGFGHDIFRSGGSIRDEPTLRAAFLNKVVLQLQYILEEGFKISVRQIFCLDDSPFFKASGATIAPYSPLPLRPIEEQREAEVSKNDPYEINQFCLHDGHGEERLDQSSAQSSEKWLSRLRQSFQLVLKHTTTETSDPIKIAILDTGASISESNVEDIYDGRLVECRTWLGSTDRDGEQFYQNDTDGHGTHGTAVLLDATGDLQCEIYVGQVFGSRHDKATQDNDETAHRIAQAIYYATDRWNVDIITMSFGYQHPVDVIDDAIQHAHSNHKLMIAAASNCGGNDKVSWPARHPQVLCIYATTGEGNPYDKNPTPDPDALNFAVLGCSVRALWLPNDNGGGDQWKHKSGTSTAAPVAAVISAALMDVLRRNKSKWLASFHGKRLEQKRKHYENKMRALGRSSQMMNVLKLMTDNKKRKDFYYIAPWSLFRDYDTETFLVERILQEIDA